MGSLEVGNWKQWFALIVVGRRDGLISAMAFWSKPCMAGLGACQVLALIAILISGRDIGLEFHGGLEKDKFIEEGAIAV